MELPQEVQSFFEANKDNAEFIQYLDTINPITNRLESILNSEDGKKLIQPKLDQHFTKGLETWKQNNLSKLVNEELIKLNPPKTEAEKKLMELESKFNMIEKEKNREAQKNKALKLLSTNGYGDLADYVENYIGEDDETTTQGLNKFTELIKKISETTEKKIYKDNGRNVDTGSNRSVFTSKDPYELSKQIYNQK